MKDKQLKKPKYFIKEKTPRSPLISICLISFKRPLFLKLCLESILKNPGIDDFELLIWDNGSSTETQHIINEFGPKYHIKGYYNKENIGQQALFELALVARGKYYVWVEDDMIWFDDEWLLKLLNAYKKKITFIAEDENGKYKKKWGMLSTNVIRDEVNNGGLWQWMIPKSYPVTLKEIKYRVSKQMTPGARIMDRELALKIEALTPNVRKFRGALSVMQLAFENKRYLTGMIVDDYVYHATNPFFNQLYPEVFLEKQEDQTVKQALAIYKKIENFNFDNKEYILEAIKESRFENYAKEAKDKCHNASL